ncbi:MAG: flagellar basal body-associated FliL family protein [Bacillota bacterium]
MNRGLITALVAAVVILAAGVAGLAAYVIFLMPQGGVTSARADGTAVIAGEPVLEAAYYELDEFVTNLADKDRLRYIKFSVALGLRSSSSEEIVENANFQVRDVILTQVRELTAADLGGADGKERLAQAIKEGLDKLLPGHVTRVYVTDMVIQ